MMVSMGHWDIVLIVSSPNAVKDNTTTLASLKSDFYFQEDHPLSPCLSPQGIQSSMGRYLPLNYIYIDRRTPVPYCSTDQIYFQTCPATLTRTERRSTPGPPFLVSRFLPWRRLSSRQSTWRDLREPSSPMPWA